MLVRVVSVADVDAAVLARELAGPGTTPRVVGLCNVGKLTPPQQAAIAGFVEKGGGLLVAPGDRCTAGEASAKWLPASLTGPVGDVNDPAKAAQPLTPTFYHPALELFREPQPGGLGDARFGIGLHHVRIVERMLHRPVRLLSEQRLERIFLGISCDDVAMRVEDHFNITELRDLFLRRQDRRELASAYAHSAPRVLPELLDLVQVPESAGDGVEVVIGKSLGNVRVVERFFLDRGEDGSSALDLAAAQRPGLEQRRVNVDFPVWMIESLDREARRLGVTRQSIIKVWIAERLEHGGPAAA